MARQKIILALWGHYVARIYPKVPAPDTNSEQYRQLKQAFYAGILAFLNFSADNMTEGPENDAAADLALLQRLDNEIREFFTVENKQK